MTGWSKSVPYNCYELGHTWEPSCAKALGPLAWDAFLYSVKIYGTLYLVTAIVRRKKKEYYIKRFIPQTVRSAIFLGSNGVIFLGSFCLWRKIFPCYFYLNTFICGVPAAAIAVAIERRDRQLIGKYVYPIPYLAAVTGSYLAIIMERKARRGMLALYLMNLAIETAFRICVSRGWVKPIAHGEVLLFSIAMGVYGYLYRSGNLKDNIRRMFAVFMGPSEQPARSLDSATPSNGRSPPADTEVRSTGAPQSRTSSVKSMLNTAWSFLPKEIQVLLTLWRQAPKHRLCRHSNSCSSHSIEAGLKYFVIGYMVQGTLRLVKALTLVFRRPRALWEALKHSDNMYCGLFLGSFALLMRMTNCLLRWLTNKDSQLHGLVSGFVAGWAMLWYKSTTIAMYAATKLAEVVYFNGIDAGVVPKFKYADVIIYTLSTAFVLHSAVYEPHNLRQGYWRFLLGLTGDRFKEMNRKLLDVYGTKASSLYPNFWPDYDPKFLVNVLPSV